MRSGLYACVFLAVFAVATFEGRSASAQGSLDGRAFAVNSTNPEEPYPDHLVFVGGNFESMGCRPFGFGPALYTTADENGVTTFSATTTSATEGSMAWTGQVAADGAISGSFTWTKEGQDPVTASFAGTAASGPLDTRIYAITFEGDDAPDGLIFDHGAFESTGCREYGFWPVAYQAAANPDGSTSWTATSYSFTEGMMSWTGTVNGNAIQGTYTWTKEGQEPSTLAFSGVEGATTNE